MTPRAELTTKRGLEGPSVVAAKLVHLSPGAKGLINKYTRLIVERLNNGGDVESLRQALSNLLVEHRRMLEGDKT